LGERPEITNEVKELIAEFRKPEYDVCCLSDAMDKLGIQCGCFGIKAVVQGVKMAGSAFTLAYRPFGVDGGTVGDYIDDVNEDEIVVIDNNGRLDCTVWGDLLSVMATRRKVAGTVIDGVCRDVPKIRQLKYPVYSRDWFMVTGKDRVKLASINEPVSIGNVEVCPGDILVGDDTGVVVIPLKRAGEVLEVAKGIAAAEARIEEAIRQGKSLREARQQTGYHKLQSKTED